MNDYESIKSKLKKLLALAEGGVEGEAHNARILLEKLCRQYGVSLDEIFNTDKKKWYVFNVGSQDIFKNLFLQCYCCVLNTGEMSYRKVSISKIGVELTAYEYAELSAMFKWHKDNFKKDMENMMDTLLISYCTKHDITSHVERTKDTPRKSMTPEEFNRLRAALFMQDSLSNNYYRKQLE